MFHHRGGVAKNNSNSGNGSFLGQQANMLIRASGRTNSKDNAKT